MDVAKLIEHRKLIKKRKPKFIRQDFHKISSLGKGRKKKQVWRKSKGRHSKVRQKLKGRRAMPGIGYSSPRLIRGTIRRKKPVIVHNVHELSKLGKHEIAIIASVGLKKKLDIIKKAAELKIEVANIDEKKILEKIEKRKEKKERIKKGEEEKKKIQASKDQDKAKKEEVKRDEEEEKKMIIKPVEPGEEIKHQEHIKTKEKIVMKKVAVEK
ncbi:hypothetical protein HZA33_01825 [Candidatus Pacearchaeota archaeon]|nr:hypothetical protein [Candidatus Pacearchaeota archaeon]